MDENMLAQALADVIPEYASEIGFDTADELTAQVGDIAAEYVEWFGDWSQEGLRIHLGSIVSRRICQFEGTYELDDNRANLVLHMMDSCFARLS